MDEMGKASRSTREAVAAEVCCPWRALLTRPIASVELRRRVSSLRRYLIQAAARARRRPI